MRVTRPVLLALATLLAASLGGCDGGGSDGDADTDTDADADTDADGDGCDGCEVDGVCHAAGDSPADDPCVVCDPDRNAAGWSDDDGAPCDDGLFCNGADSCSGGSCSEHAGDPCPDDEVYCNGAESCDEDAGECVGSGSPCETDELCFEEEGRCCEPAASRGCDESGDAVWLDSCGRPGSVAEDCAEPPGGQCVEGECSCAAGFGGEACDTCVIHVGGATAADGNDGLAWATALATVGAALDAAELYGCEIWVAAGTYRPTDGTDRDATFELRPGVALYGGFLGTEAAREERDPAANRTVLSGDLGVMGEVADNSRHVVTGADDATLDGFVVSGGNAEADDFSEGSGGGLRCVGTSPTVVGCTFEGNQAIRNGGGVHVERSASPVFEGCTFRANHAEERGGGLNAVGSRPLLSGCTFEANTARDFGGGVYVYDGAIGLPLLPLERCTFRGNVSALGGGLAADNQPLLVVGCTFEGNEGTTAAGGFGSFGADSVVASSLFAGNRSSFGGAIHFEHESSPLVVASTIVNNTEGWGAGIFVNSATATVVGSILWGNRGIAILGEWEHQVHWENGGTLTVTYSDIEGGSTTAGFTAGDIFVPPGFEPGTYRLGAGSPCIDGGDATALPEDLADLDDDGDTSEPTPLDLDGNPRVAGAGVDMGAYERP